MSELRAWIPTLMAGLVMLPCLAIGTHVSRPLTSLPPLPKTVRVHHKAVTDLGAELSSPLFTPSRSVAAAGSAPTPQAPPPVVTGIVLGSGRGVALVKSASGGETLMLHVGAAVDGWTIVGIAARQIVVARDGAQQTVALQFGKASTPDSRGTGATGISTVNAASPSFDGLAAARHLGLPAANIPLGSPLVPQK